MKIVFSDLDGTLLDHDHYSFTSAQSGLTLLKNNNIPLILCTSKTRAEIIYWRKQLDNQHPFISENGGAIYIPLDYFSFSIPYTDKTDSFYRIGLGEPLSILKETMDTLEQRYSVESILSMSLETLRENTGLPQTQAELARQREFDIPFLLNDSSQLKQITQFIKKQHLHLTKGGRFYHLIGDNDKGKAVTELIRFYRQQNDNIESIGIGDSENDFPMLHMVKHPYLVRKKDGTVASHKFTVAKGIGPAGWQQIIEHEFNHI